MESFAGPYGNILENAAHTAYEVNDNDRISCVRYYNTIMVFYQTDCSTDVADPTVLAFLHYKQNGTDSDTI